MWFVIVVIFIIAIIFFRDKGQDSYPRQTTSRPDTSNEMREFEQLCKDTAEEIMRDSRTGCRFGGYCVYDSTEDDEEVCYCRFSNEYVKRHSPCPHFKAENHIRS